jgi:hypothetical protein
MSKMRTNVSHPLGSLTEVLDNYDLKLLAITAA